MFSRILIIFGVVVSTCSAIEDGPDVRQDMEKASSGLGSPLDLHQEEQDHDPQGEFMKDISFANFFQDIGLDPDGPPHPKATPSIYPLPTSSYPSQDFPQKDQQQGREGFMPYNPLRGFLALEGSHAPRAAAHPPSQGFFESFDPFADEEDRAHARTHSNPDYDGPPDDFFDDHYGDPRAEETRTQEGKEKGKCEVVHKDGMECEVCKDDYGGFSEHCSHSIRSGNDKKYANAKRKEHDEPYNPYRSNSHQHQMHHVRRPKNFKYHSQHQPPIYDSNKHRSRSRNTHRDYAQSRSDEGRSHRKPHSSNQNQLFEYNFDPYTDENDDPHYLSSDNVDYKPLDPEENYRTLGKMLNTFAKKDRSECEKVIKKGMTCYRCPNNYGQIDEDCMYENDDPKGGEHIMYTEEISY